METSILDRGFYSLTNTGLVSLQPVFNFSLPQSLQGDLLQGLVSTLFTTTMEGFLSWLKALLLPKDATLQGEPPAVELVFQKMMALFLDR